MAPEAQTPSRVRAYGVRVRSPYLPSSASNQDSIQADFLPFGTMKV